jgi:hypothetical protein
MASPEQEAGLTVTTGRRMTAIIETAVASGIVRYTFLCEEPVLYCACNPQEIPRYTVGI